MTPPLLDPTNQREYNKLLVSLTANVQRLDLLLAICDDRHLQDQIITAYEIELREQGITPFRARLDLKQPSLRATLEDLVEQESILQSQEPAVVTVLNANELLGVRLTDDKSEQEQFFFSLQWTREALRHFDFPIVLWLSDAIATRLAQQAPDFWSWRGGVFEFKNDEQSPKLARQFSLVDRDFQIKNQQELLSPEKLSDQIENLIQNSPGSPLLATLYAKLGVAYQSSNRDEKALSSYKTALKLAESRNDYKSQAEIQFNLAEVLARLGRIKQAIVFYEKSISSFCQIQSHYGEAYALLRMANAYEDLGDFQRSISLLAEAKAVFEKINSTAGITLVLDSLGTVYRKRGEYEAAVETLERALSISRENNDIEGEISSLNNLGGVYNQLNMISQAKDIFEKVLQISRKINNSSIESASLQNLGNIHSSLGNYQMALKLYQEALHIYRSLGNAIGEGNALGGIGNTYASLSQYQKAVKAFKESLDIFEKIGVKEEQAITAYNLGNAYYFLGKYQEALFSYGKALEGFRQTQSKFHEAQTLMNLSKTLVTLNQLLKAKTYLQAARKLYEDAGFKEKVEQCDVALYSLG